MQEDNTKNQNEKVSGYMAFLDIEDRDLRIHNQAAVLRNILEDHAVQTKKGERVSAKGASIAVDYFSQITQLDKKDVLNAVAKLQVEASRVVTMQ